MTPLHMFDRAFLQIRPKVALNFRRHLIRRLQKAANLDGNAPLTTCEMSLRGEDLVIICAATKTFSGTINKGFQFKHGLLSSLTESNPWGRAPLEFGFKSANRTGNRVEIILAPLPDLSPIVNPNTVCKVPLSLPKTFPAAVTTKTPASEIRPAKPKLLSPPRSLVTPLESPAAAQTPVAPPPAVLPPLPAPASARIPGDKLVSEAGVSELLTAMLRKLVGVDSIEAGLATVTQRQLALEESLKGRIAQSEKSIAFATETLDNSAAKLREDTSETLQRASKAVEAATAAAEKALKAERQILSSLSAAGASKPAESTEDQKVWTQLISDELRDLARTVEHLTKTLNINVPAAEEPAPTQTADKPASIAPEPQNAAATQPAEEEPVVEAPVPAVSAPPSIRLHRIALIVTDSSNKGTMETAMAAHGIGKIADVDLLTRCNKFLTIPTGYDGIVVHQDCSESVRKARNIYGHHRMEIYRGGHTRRDQAIRDLVAKLPPVQQVAA